MSNDTPNTTVTPAGWYPDSSNEQLERFWDGTTWTAQTRMAGPQGTDYKSARAQAKAAKATAKRTRPWHAKKRFWALGVIALIVVIAIGTSGGDPSTGTDSGTAADGAPASDKKESGEKAKPKYTASQEQAIGAAENYVDVMPFSKKGLIRQLSSDAGDGFPKADARFAANHIKVDWNAEAAEAAKNYLDSGMNFSRDSLIQQLTSSAGDQFTPEQAAYAADKVGL